MQKLSFLALCCSMLAQSILAQQAGEKTKPFRVGVVGLVHTHVHWILGREKKGDIEIAGIAEPNRALAEAYAKQHGFPMSLVYSTMEEMIEHTKPEAVLAFNSIYDHLRTVQYCAPRGIHVMVEKPLAVSVDHASQMIALARKHNIHLLTNYETTWYGSNTSAYALLADENKIGPIRRIVFHTGHPGPVEIGCNPEFLEWLTDPILNGGGALTDFGCYGANLATWFMKGAAPVSVSAITQQIKPDLYPKVEDEATILLTYPKAQVIIQASWNWPFSRKDMEVYGKTGYVFCLDKQNMLIRTSESKPAESIAAPPLASDRNDPFIYFANVVRGNIQVAPYDLSATPNNEMVIKILEAAKHAAKTGQTVIWKDFFRE
jgi:predicted dehydrogenase